MPTFMTLSLSLSPFYAPHLLCNDVRVSLKERDGFLNAASPNISVVRPVVSSHTTEARLSCGVSSNSWSSSSWRGVATAPYPPAVRCRKSNMSRQEMVPSECTKPPPTSRNCTCPRRGRAQRRKAFTVEFFSLRGFGNSPLGNRPWVTQPIRFKQLAGLFF